MNAECMCDHIYNVMRKALYFSRSVKGTLRRRTSVHSVQVYLRRSDFDGLPPLPDISPLYVKELSPDNEPEIDEWLGIVNQAFSRNWEKGNYINNIIDHKVYDVCHTYVLMSNNKYIGTISEAVFRKNPEVGVTHYLGLKEDYVGQGLGKYLTLYVLHEMKSHNGIKSCEAETTLKYRKSLSIHFDFGFFPKIAPDYWNTQTLASPLMRAIAHKKLKQLYQESQKGRMSTPLELHQ